MLYHKYIIMMVMMMMMMMPKFLTGRSTRRSTTNALSLAYQESSQDICKSQDCFFLQAVTASINLNA